MSDEGRGIILSVKPIWAGLILAGSKTVELRRRFPRLSDGKITALLYSTSPTKALVGRVDIDETVIMPPDELWPQVADRSIVTERQFRAYFDGAKEAVALFLSTPTRFTSPVPLSQLRSSGFSPPMSWRRAKPAELKLFNGLV